MTPKRKELTWFAAALGLFLSLAPSRAGTPPPWLPTYDVAIDLDFSNHTAQVQLRATWTNPHNKPAEQLVFNAHSCYIVPSAEIGLVAKTIELLRARPSEGLVTCKPPCQINRIFLLKGTVAAGELPFQIEGDTATTLVVYLPKPVPPGQSVTIQVDLTMHLPNKQGRVGQWREITFLSNWLPVFAFYGVPPPPKPNEAEPPKHPPTYDACWQPTRFIPWHQPFFNEAGHYHVWVQLPADQKIACSGSIVASKDLPDGRCQVEIQAPAVRDFAFLCSPCYQDHNAEIDLCPGRAPVRVHVMALPQHEHYAKEMLRIAVDALKTYSKWFGPYPYPDFTIAESYFPWNGNECGTLVMIDERVFGMPHMGLNFIESLVSHEICHQWWYNMVGTNGYCETWMDEALATYFSHKLLDQKLGKNNLIIHYPRGLEWLPNIRREDYRVYGMYGTIGRGEIGPAVQDMPLHGHVINLFSNCYDKGSRIVGMIEERLTEAGFADFMRLVFNKYQYRILRVADYQRELEAYTGTSWEEFFRHWLYGKGMSDWAVSKVVVQPPPSACTPDWLLRARAHRAGPPTLDNPQGLIRVTIFLEQKAEYNEQTCLGIRLKGQDGYPIRIPIRPEAKAYHYDNPPSNFQTVGEKQFRVEVLLPGEPEQITVDPDQVLVDPNPINNFWKTPIRWRFSPFYTFLDETDLTNNYDSWNVIAGPWLYGASYSTPWFTRAISIGARVGVYRTQNFSGGAYLAYRTDFRDVVAGVDGTWEHWPGSHWEFGFNAEQRLATVYQGDDNAKRAVVYGRYIFDYGSSLYLAPFKYLDFFTSYSDNFLPFTRGNVPGGERFDHATTAGLHYQLNYLTPYWDAEGGIYIDTFVEAGVAQLNRPFGVLGVPQWGGEQGVQKMAALVSGVKSLPDLTDTLDAFPHLQAWVSPVLKWLGDTRLAYRVYGGMAFPLRGEFFTLGGSQMFRAFDLRQRQGNAVWIGSLEWRVPLATGLTWDLCDHIMGIRGLYGVGFYEAGNSYLNGHQIGDIAHGVGAGLRVDVSWFSFVERSVLRVDFAKCINEATPWQVWFGFQHAF